MHRIVLISCTPHTSSSDRIRACGSAPLVCFHVLVIIISSSVEQRLQCRLRETITGNGDGKIVWTEVGLLGQFINPTAVPTTGEPLVSQILIGFCTCVHDTSISSDIITSITPVSPLLVLVV